MLRHFARVPPQLGRSAQGILCLSARSLSQVQAVLTTEVATESVPVGTVVRVGNGLRVAVETTHSPLATVAVVVEAGSRFETSQTNGVAKLLEHTILKGTKTRNQATIEKEIELLGGQLNVVTDRETTALYTTIPAGNVPNAIGLLADVIQHPTISEAVLEVERDAVIREMQDIDKCQLDQVVLDHLHSTGYQGTPLSQSVLGRSKNTLGLTRQDILDYHKANFGANRTVVSVAGSVDQNEVVKAVEKHFGSLGTAPPVNFSPPRVIGSDLRYRDDDIPLAHVGIAVEGVGWLHPDYPALQVAVSLLGSWNKSLSVGNLLASPLAQQCCREDICESYTHFNHSHTDTGLFGVYMVCNRLTIEDIVHETLSEWMRVAINARDSEVQKAKNITKFNVLANAESTLACANNMGRQVLAYGRPVPLAETIARINAIDTKTLKQVLIRHLYDRDPVVVGVGPVEDLPDYNRIQSALWWARF